MEFTDTFYSLSGCLTLLFLFYLSTIQGFTNSCLWPTCSEFLGNNDQKKSCERLMRSKICHFLFGYSLIYWAFNFCQPQACVIMLIFIAALFEQYQVTSSIFTIIEALFMFAWIGQTFLENVRE